MIGRGRSSVGSALLAVFLVASPGAAGPPPGLAGSAWDETLVGVVSREPCDEWFGRSRCTRTGGLAALGSTGLLVNVEHLESEFGDPDYAVHRRSADGGDSWGVPKAFVTAIDAPPPTWYPALSQRGSDLDVIFQRPDVERSIWVRSSDDLGATWGPRKRFPQPGMVVTNLAIARGPAGRVALAVAAYDEVPGPGPDSVVQVRVSSDGGTTFPVVKTFGWEEGYCWATGTDPSIAVTKGGVIVLAYWRTCTRLLVRRSTDGGRTWSTPRRLSSGPHTMGMALAAHANQLVLAYTAGGETFTRHSADRGRTWSGQTGAGSGATSLRLAHAGDAWRLLAGGTDRIRYRSSSNGRDWSEGETVAESIGARTYAIGVAYGTNPLAAYVMRTPDKVFRLYVARR